MTRLIAATHNEAKLAELRRLVGESAKVSPLPSDISLEDQETRTALSEAEEGRSVEEIAAAKAVEWSRILPGELVIVSDGGLLIPALGDEWDPTRTRRFAGADATDYERAEALLALASSLKGKERQISWREAVAIAKDGKLLGNWSAESEPGLLATDVDSDLVAAGRGFWIEAVWMCPEAGGKHLARLNQKECARRVDHWSQLESPLRQFLVMINH
jgi:inosine/xanthosine triphosphate pyrophosphatase family protein